MIKRILVVEDDEAIQEYLKKLLTEADYAVHTASDGIAAIAMVEKHNPDMVILDLGLPKVSGETVCREIKKHYPQIPVIVLTARNQSADVVQGFKLGADDYVSKPFVGDELLARIKARFNAVGEEHAQLAVGELTLDAQTYEVKRGSKLIALTQKEFELLKYLMSNKGKVLTRDMILNKVWLYSPDIESRVVDVYMGYLRRKIDAEAKKKLIHSIRGFGYTIKDTN